MGTGFLSWISGYAKTYWVIALLISVFVGHFIPRYVTKHLYKVVEEKTKNETDKDRPIVFITELPRWIGWIERTLVTLVVMWLPASAGTVIAALLALKMAGGWGALKTGTTKARAVYSVSLVGSLLSILWAVLCGVLAAPWWPSQIIK
jgi:hypothetical protein